jgi:hypothetical protein
MRFRLVIFFVLVGLLSVRARAEQQLSLTADASRLSISGLPRIASPAVEVTSDDAIPIVWFYRDAKEAELPLVLMPGVADTAVFRLIKRQRAIVIADQPVPQVKIDEAAYAKLANWRPTSSMADRRSTLLLAVAMGTTLLLASLARRGAVVAVATVAAAWGVALAISSTTRPTLVTRDDGDGMRWFLAVEPQPLRIPIGSGETAVPIVESAAHLRSVAPRIVVEGTDATLEFDLPRGSKVGVLRSAR